MAPACAVFRVATRDTGVDGSPSTRAPVRRASSARVTTIEPVEVGADMG